MRKPKPAPVVGQVRWVHYDRGGDEHDFETEPEDLPTLRVEVIAVGNGGVEEQTWTHNLKLRLGGAGGCDWCPILPPGARLAGWVMADPFVDGSASTRWVRRRENTEFNQEEKADT